MAWSTCGTAGPTRRTSAGLVGGDGTGPTTAGGRSWGGSRARRGGGEGRWSLLCLPAATGSWGLRRPPRAAGGSPWGVVGRGRPIFPGRMEGQKSRRVIGRLRCGRGTGGGGATGAAVRVLIGGACMTGRRGGPASQVGRTGGEGEEYPCRLARSPVLLISVGWPGVVNLPSQGP